MSRIAIHADVRQAINVFFSIALLWATPAAASQLAILQSSNLPIYQKTVQAFRDNLPSHLRPIHEFSLNDDMAGASNVAEEIRALDVSMVVAVGLKAALAVKRHLGSIPSVFCMVLHPSRYQLTEGNMAGIALDIPFEEQIRALHLVNPKLRRIGALYNPEKTGHVVDVAKTRVKRLGVELLLRPVSSEKDVPAKLREMVTMIDALWLIPDSTVVNQDSLPFLMETTLEAEIPVLGFSTDLVRRGALVSVHFSHEDVGKQAALLTKDFMNGREFSPGVVFAPDPLRRAINLKTAKYLKLSLRPQALSRFDERY